MLIRKRTDLWAPPRTIIAESEWKHCDGTHDHAVLGRQIGNPNFKPTRSIRVWPTPFCAALARTSAIVM